MESLTIGSMTKAEQAAGGIISVTPAGDFNPPLAPFRERLSWALYDFANTVFSMNIATLYFAAWLVADLGHSNTLYAVVNGIASASSSYRFRFLVLFLMRRSDESHG